MFGTFCFLTLEGQRQILRLSHVKMFLELFVANELIKTTLTLATNGANMCVGVCVTCSAQPLTETETSVAVYTGQSTESFCFFRWKPQTVAEVTQRR